MEGTSLLLVEMPMVRWTQHMCDVLAVLNSRREITVLLAHIERYLTLQPPDVLERLRGHGIPNAGQRSVFPASKHQKTGDADAAIRIHPRAGLRLP